MEQLISRLRYFPVSLFTATMGLIGLALVAQHGARTWSFPVWIGQILLGVATVVFAVATALYLTKTLRHKDALVAELKHPVMISFFPAFSISLLLLAAAFLDIHSMASRTLWAAGVVFQSVLTLWVVSSWIGDNRYKIEHVNPSWFLPAIGNVLIPIAGMRLYPAEVSWFFFSIGIVLWLVLLTIVFYRMVFYPALSSRLVPTICILMAPPAAAFLGYINLVGGVDPFAHVLYYTALFMALLVVLQYQLFLQLRFTSSWWALAFPLAVVTLATMRFYELLHWPFSKELAAVLCVLLVAVILLLIVLTLRAAIRNELLVPED